MQVISSAFSSIKCPIQRSLALAAICSAHPWQCPVLSAGCIAVPAQLAPDAPRSSPQIGSACGTRRSDQRDHRALDDARLRIPIGSTRPTSILGTDRIQPGDAWFHHFGRCRDPIPQHPRAPRGHPARLCHWPGGLHANRAILDRGCLLRNRAVWLSARCFDGRCLGDQHRGRRSPNPPIVCAEKSQFHGFVTCLLGAGQPTKPEPT